jgi:hypothetical protein
VACRTELGPGAPPVPWMISTFPKSDFDRMAAFGN